MPELLINGEDTMAVNTVNQLERHVSGTFLAVFDAAGRAEAALTAERNKFPFATVRTGIHSTAEGRVATMYHLGDIFHFDVSGMKGILDDFVVVSENFL